MSRTTAPTHTAKPGAAWTAEEARRFLAVAADDIYAPFWQLAVYLGMRPSEVAGLRWESVDLDAGTLKVERARPTAMGKTFATDDTKSPSGKRTLAMPHVLVAILRAHRASENVHVLHGLVCTSSSGAALDHRAVQRRFHALCLQAGVTNVRGL